MFRPRGGWGGIGVGVGVCQMWQAQNIKQLICLGLSCNENFGGMRNFGTRLLAQTFAIDFPDRRLIGPLLAWVWLPSLQV
jgi:hypothetical protein